MPIYDYECTNMECRHIHERYARADQEEVSCPRCAADAVRIISASGHFCANEDADWIRTVTEVVDREDKSPTTQRFLKNPTRTNLKRFMSEKGLVPLENERGGPPVFKGPPPVDSERLTKATFERFRKRNRLEIRG